MPSRRSTRRFDLAAYIALDPRPGMVLEPIRAAFLNGSRAARAGRLRRSNPYAGPRGGSRVAWSVLADYWDLGYEFVHPARQEQLL